MLADKLKLLYPGAVEWDNEQIGQEHYLWLTIDKQKVGLPKSSLSAEEMQLLASLFGPLDPGIQLNRTRAQLEWHRFFAAEGPIPITNRESVRLFHFRLTNPAFPAADFEQAFLSFFPDESILIWEDRQSGLVLESETHAPLLLEELKDSINILESDFFTAFRIFSGKFHPVDEQLRHHYNMEKLNFRTVLSHSKAEKISSLKTTFPLVLQNGIEQDKEWYVQELLGDIQNDDEMMKTVKTYILCGQNATLAAKELYVHRNSLQYRIDKFIERTGLDVRTFHDAMIAYLAILLI